MRNFTKTELKALQAEMPTDDEVMHHVVYCHSCNEAYSKIMIHTKKAKMKSFMIENDIDKRHRLWKWSTSK